MPGRDFLALMLKIGFHRVGLMRYTGFKSSPYTEGALFYGEKLVDARVTEEIAAQAGQLAAEAPRVECAPGST
jgi:hypothetical protein